MREWICQTNDEFIIAAEQFNWKLFSLDTECDSLRYKEQDLQVITVCDGTNVMYIDIDKVTLFLIKDYMCGGNYGKGRMVIMHNSPFDGAIIGKFGLNIINAEFFDTMVAEHLIDERNSKSLKDMAQRYLGVTTIDYESAKGTDKFIKYAMNDAEWTWKIAEIQVHKLKELGLETLFRRIEMPFQKVLIELRKNGILVDVKKLEESRKMVEDYIADKTVQMCNYAKIKYTVQYDLFGNTTIQPEVDFNSTKELDELLFTDMQIESVGKTKTGRNLTGKEFLLKMKDKNEFVQMLYEYRTACKLLTSFLTPLPDFIDSDNRVRSDFIDTGTRTGRLASAHPNMQQLSKDKLKELPKVRELFIATPGYKIITCDYSGQELRVLAQVTDDQGLIDAFNSGQDFHSETAKLFNVDRTKAKAINFGIAYRKGAFGFSKDWGVTEEEAQKYLDAYFSKFPKVKEAMEQNDKFLSKNGFVRTMAGRYRHFDKEEWGGYVRKAYRESFNFLIQGFSADMMRIALIRVMNVVRRNPTWDLRIIGTCHDEGIFEVKEKFLNEASLAIKEAFESSVKFKVPVLAEIGVGDNYYEAK